ncbi:hypothetical protein ACHAWT_001607 [Skeletonema menzelii]
MSNPKQLKAVLTSLREAIASLETEATTNSTSIKSFCLVLTSELSSRGIAANLPQGNDNYDSSSEWIVSLLESIQMNAGKVAIDDVDNTNSSNYPAPMMAALNAAQGMAVSACAKICCPVLIYNHGDEHLDAFELLPINANKDIAKAYKDALKRCQDVEDGRLYTLLQLVTNLHSVPDNVDKSSLPKSKIRQFKLKQLRQLQYTFYTMAYANYLHGAVNYAVDQPPMWKRCLDSALLLNGSNDDDDDNQDSFVTSTNNNNNESGRSELNYKAYFNSRTIQPLNNMIRIAQAKGNEKRAKELSLLLAVGYLGGVRERLQDMKKTNKDSSAAAAGSRNTNGEEEKKLNTLSVKELVQQFYVDRTPLPIELEIMTVPSLLEYSKKALSACDAPTTIEDTSSLSSLEKESWILYHYIQEQMVHLAEESMIWSDVHRQYRSMLNRKPESNIPSIGAKKSKTTTGTKKVVASSKEEMEQQTRTKVYAEAYDEWKVDSLQLDSLPSLALRDAVLSLSSSLKIIPQSMTDIIQDCYRSLIHQMERLEAMAVIVQKKSKTSAKDVLSMWEALLSFISPLMGGRQDSDNFLSSNVPLRNLLETCSEAIIVASWMCEPIVGSGDNVSNEINNLSKLLSDAQRLLTACKVGRVEEKRLLDEKNKEESVLSSKESQSDLEKKLALRLECAIETSRCRAEIDSVLDADGVDINAITAIARRATISATGGFKNIADCNSPLLSASSSKALFGTPYLHFLSVWSGMYLSPWPYCNVGQARAILKQARDALRLSAKYWGRRSSNLEDLLLDIGEADLENVLLGGNADASSRLYHQALAKLEGKDGEENASGNALVREKLKVQCLIGLARQSLSVGNPEVAETHARSALNMLLSSDPTLNQGGVPTLLCSHAWCAPALNQLRHSHQLCSSRQLVAESCIQSSRFDDARSFLTDAVKEVPGNFDAAFSLASFYLRMHCMGKESDENETRKSLLRAAKMDTSKASPFALLGIWYESKNDAKRAEGCYQKALSLDASHPVAGRGLQRLIALEDLVPHCKKAIEQNSPVNGWAWQALGESKALHEGDDSTAVICFQQALRCRDIQSPSSDMLGAFYSYTELAATVHSEASMTWVELATCYRRMGKYSAALRAYEEAASTGTLPPAALCSWAQCDLDLGLYAEAAEKCDDVLACEDCPTGLIRMASYIEAEALLSIARTDIQGGKNGSCRSHLVKAITRLEGLCPQNSTYCEIKLLGDLYSFGEALPPYVFDQIPSGEGDALGADSSLSAEVEDKISFLQKGEEAYAKALELAARMDDQEEGDKIFLLAATGTDLGINLLSQARTIAVAHGDGSGGDTKTAIADLTAESDRVKDLILRSINAFSQAIDHSPNDAGAWCGLGSALIFVDPLLSQHAFCRALQIDKSIAEPLSSIALLYADYDKTDKSAEILDALTQLEDTPLMWIGRGLLLEKTSRAWHDSPASREGCLTRASDAYRASLQIMQHPAALLGLSLTCRRADADVQTSNDKLYSSLADHSSKVESRISMTLHQSTTGGGNIGASMIDGLFRIEEGLDAVDSSEASRMIKEGVKRIEQARSRSSSKISNDITSSGTKCEINFSSAASLQKKDNGEFPNDGIEKSLSEAARDLALDSPAAVQEYSLDQARNAVVLNPDSGESWLLLAKELTQAASSLNDAAATSETLSSAKAAADKALDLLQDQLLNACLVAPRRKVVHHENLIEYSEKSVVSAIPPSPLVSDAMSLVCWLGSMDEENQPQRSCATLQESLLLNPLNEVAATALGL